MAACRRWLGIGGIAALLVIVGCESRQAREQRELADLVAKLKPYWEELRRVDALIARGADYAQVKDALVQAQEIMGGIDRPETQSARVDELYDSAKAVGRTMEQASDGAVRDLAGAGDDREFQRATARAMQTMMIQYRRASDAFQRNYAAAKQDVQAATAPSGG